MEQSFFLIKKIKLMSKIVFLSKMKHKIQVELSMQENKIKFK
jgi:hypothetical protein